jgi:hypothetical protein
MRANTDWFMACKWGVAILYLSPVELTAAQWNERVDRFDVERLACQLESIGARYCMIAIGQNSGHYCSPNATYDSIVPVRPSKCSQRDLVNDLHEATASRGINLMVYLPSGSPAGDEAAMKALEWKFGQFPIYGGENYQDKGKDDRLVHFQLKWEAVISEWSKRWGKKVRGWWFDGCYFPKAMYEHRDRPNFQSFAAAAKAGNPDSLVAFNPGVFTPVRSLTEFEDYTAGEITEAFPTCPGRWVDGAQYHVFSHLGAIWGHHLFLGIPWGNRILDCLGKDWKLGNPRFPDEFVLGYTKHVNSNGGVVTWDVPITSEGLIPKLFMDQLKPLRDL